MTIEQALLIKAIVVTIGLLWLLDRAAQAFWRWWRLRRAHQLWRGGPVLPTRVPRKVGR